MPAPTADQPLRGMRVVEGRPSSPARLGGLTLAQLGAEVVRIDPLGGGPDSPAGRWPPTGESLLLGRAEQGQALGRGRPALARGPASWCALIAAPGPGGGICPRPTSSAVRWLGYDAARRRAARPHPSAGPGPPRRRPASTTRSTPAVGCPAGHRPAQAHAGPVNHVLPGLGRRSPACTSRWPCWPPSGTAASDRRGRLRRARPVRRGAGHGRATSARWPRPSSGGDRPRATATTCTAAFGLDFETADGRRVMVVAPDRPAVAAPWSRRPARRGHGRGGQALGVDLPAEAGRYRPGRDRRAAAAPGSRAATWPTGRAACSTHAARAGRPTDASPSWSPTTRGARGEPA